jgi:hypothetical protein
MTIDLTTAARITNALAVVDTDPIALPATVNESTNATATTRTNFLLATSVRERTAVLGSTQLPSNVRKRLDSLPGTNASSRILTLPTSIGDSTTHMHSILPIPKVNTSTTTTTKVRVAMVRVIMRTVKTS